MSMIKIDNDRWIASDTIAEVSVNQQANVLTVRTKNGIGHSVDPDYGVGIYKTADRLIDEINKAT